AAMDRMEGEQMTVSRYLRVIAFGVAVNPCTAQAQARAWINGHVVDMHTDRLVLRASFYPQIAVRFPDQAVVTVQETDPQANNLVTVEGRTKMTLSRQRRCPFIATG